MESYRSRNAHEDLYKASTRTTRPPPMPSLPPPPPVPASVPRAAAAPAAEDPLFGSNGLLDRIVLTRHWDYFMDSQAPQQHQQPAPPAPTGGISTLRDR